MPDRKPASAGSPDLSEAESTLDDRVGGGPGVQPPGLTSPLLARATMVPTGQAAAPSRSNVRHPATAQVLRRTHWPLTGCRQVSEHAHLTITSSYGMCLRHRWMR